MTGSQQKVSHQMWHDSLSIDNSLADQEHKRQLDVISQILYAREANLSSEDVEKLFYDLANDLVLHCFHEEIMMEKIGYPEKASHTKDHHSIFSVLASLGAEVEKDKEGSKEKFFRYISGYIVSHINTHDRALAAFRKQQKELGSD